jgi:hypothetical protein
MRVTGSTTAYASGAGTEITYISGSTKGGIQVYDRTASAYRDVFLDGANNLFQISGSEQMRLNSTGLGIGTSSPTSKLTIKQSLSYDGIRLLSNNATTQNLLALYHNDTTAFVETTYLGSGSFTNLALNSQGGNVGIGTSSPVYKLDVQSSTAASYVVQSITNTNSTGYVRQIFNVGASGANGQADISYVPGTFFVMGPSVNDTTTPIVFRNNNATERMRINSSGNVGIGTNSPSNRFTVSDNSASAMIYGTQSGAGDLFAIANSASEKFRITNAGNVGIGTSSPSFLLQVGTTSTNGTTLQAGAVTLSSYSAQGLIAGGAYLTSGGTWYATNTASGQINFLGSGAMTFSTQAGLTVASSFTPTEVMRLDSSGRLVIGSTTANAKLNVNTTTYSAVTNGEQVLIEGTSAWTQGLAFSIWGAGTYASGYASGYIGAPNTTNQLYISGGAVVVNNTGAGNWAKALNTTSASFMVVGGGATTFYGNTGLTANTAYTPNQLMQLDASGNLGIGTSSPSAKLEVNQAATSFPGFKISGSSSPGMQIVEATGVTGHFANDSAGVYAGSSTNFPFILRTNNTERARIDTSGNLLVGITSGSYKFMVGDGTRDMCINPNSTLDGIFLGTIQSKPLIFGTNNTERMRIDSSGNVGIGTSSPVLAKLTVAALSTGTISTVDANSTAGIMIQGTDARVRLQLGIGNNAIGPYGGWIQASYDNISAQGVEALLLNPIGGNVGIGLTAPTAKLDVAGGVSISGWSNNNSGTAGGMEIGWDGSQSLVQSYNRVGGAYVPLGFSASKHVFNIGNVGVGTTNPLEKLQVAGAIRTTANANNFSGAVGAVFDYYAGSARFAAYDGTNTGQMSLTSGGVLTAPLVTAGGRNVRASATINMSDTSTFLTTTYYPVYIPTPQDRTATRHRIQVGLNSNVPSWGTHSSGFAIMLDWSVNGSGWGTIGVSRVIHSYAESWTNLRICGGIQQFTSSSFEVVYLRGGGIYYYEGDGEQGNAPSVSSTSFVTNGQTISPTTSIVNEIYNAGQGRQGFGTVSAQSQPALLIASQPSDIGWNAGSVINYGYSGYTSVFDNYSSYNAGNGRYTAPMTGTYFISFTANGRDGNSPGVVPRAYPRINGSYIGAQLHLRGNSDLSRSGGDLDQRTMAIVVKLSAGDYIDVYVGSGSWDTFGANYFTAYMVG